MKHAGKRHFSATINREKLREFVQRRRINAFGLLALTVLSVVITLALAFIFLHEPFTTKSLIGAALITVGTLVMVL